MHLGILLLGGCVLAAEDEFDQWWLQRLQNRERVFTPNPTLPPTLSPPPTPPPTAAPTESPTPEPTIPTPFPTAFREVGVEGMMERCNYHDKLNVCVTTSPKGVCWKERWNFDDMSMPDDVLEVEEAECEQCVDLAIERLMEYDTNHYKFVDKVAMTWCSPLDKRCGVVKKDDPTDMMKLVDCSVEVGPAPAESYVQIVRMYQTQAPTVAPTDSPTFGPTFLFHTKWPTGAPSIMPTPPTEAPTQAPSMAPTIACGDCTGFVEAQMNRARQVQQSGSFVQKARKEVKAVLSRPMLQDAEGMAVVGE